MAKQQYKDGNEGKEENWGENGVAKRALPILHRETIFRAQFGKVLHCIETVVFHGLLRCSASVIGRHTTSVLGKPTVWSASELVRPPRDADAVDLGIPESARAWVSI